MCNYFSLRKNFSNILFFVYVIHDMYVIDKSWCTWCSIYVYLNFYILKQKPEASLYILQSSHIQTLRWDWDKVDHHALQCLRKTSNQMKMDFVRFIVTTQLIMHDRDIYWAHFTRTPLSNWTNRVIVPLPKVGQLLSGEQISEEGSVRRWFHHDSILGWIDLDKCSCCWNYFTWIEVDFSRNTKRNKNVIDNGIS